MAASVLYGCGYLLLLWKGAQNDAHCNFFVPPYNLLEHSKDLKSESSRGSITLPTCWLNIHKKFDSSKPEFDKIWQKLFRSNFYPPNLISKWMDSSFVVILRILNCFVFNVESQRASKRTHRWKELTNIRTFILNFWEKNEFRSKEYHEYHWHSILFGGGSVNLVLLLHPFFCLFFSFFRTFFVNELPI